METTCGPECEKTFEHFKEFPIKAISSSCASDPVIPPYDVIWLKRKSWDYTAKRKKQNKQQNNWVEIRYYIN